MRLTATIGHSLIALKAENWVHRDKLCFPWRLQGRVLPLTLRCWVCWKSFVFLTSSPPGSDLASIFPQPSFSWAYASKSFSPHKDTRSRDYPPPVWSPLNTAISSKTLLSNEVILKPSRVRPGASFSRWEQVNSQPCPRQVWWCILLCLSISLTPNIHLSSWNLVPMMSGQVKIPSRHHTSIALILWYLWGRNQNIPCPDSLITSHWCFKAILLHFKDHLMMKMCFAKLRNMATVCPCCHSQNESGFQPSTLVWLMKSLECLPSNQAVNSHLKIASCQY